MKVKKMYHICMVDGIFRALIDVKGEPNQYGIPKVFETKDAAESWIKKNSYKGMSWRYEIREVIS